MFTFPKIGSSKEDVRGLGCCNLGSGASYFLGRCDEPALIDCVHSPSLHQISNHFPANCMAQ